jgi:hypothetical protein
MWPEVQGGQKGTEEESWLGGWRRRKMSESPLSLNTSRQQS